MFSLEIDNKQLVNISQNIDKGVLEIVNSSLNKTTANYLEKVEQLAIKELYTTRRRFLSCIRMIEDNDGGKTIYLDYASDKLVELINEGHNTIDLKKAVLNGSKVKLSVDGKRYATIPMSTINAISVANAPNSIVAVSKGKSQIFNEKNIEKIEISLTTPAYSKKNEDSTLSSYLSFRRINDESDGFQIPQKEGKNILETVFEEFNWDSEFENELNTITQVL